MINKANQQTKEQKFECRGFRKLAILSAAFLLPGLALNLAQQSIAEDIPSAQSSPTGLTDAPATKAPDVSPEVSKVQPAEKSAQSSAEQVDKSTTGDGAAAVVPDQAKSSNLDNKNQVDNSPNKATTTATNSPSPKPSKSADSSPPKGIEQALKLYNSGKYLLAQKQFEKFIKDGVADENTHYYLANCFYRQKQYTKAMKEFEWVAKNANHSLSLKQSGEKYAYSIKCYKAGICPGNCLKANDPRWQRMRVDGHPDTDVWIKFSYAGGHHAWNQNHIGDVIEYVNGRPENKGPCQICGGTTKVTPLKDGV